MSYERIFLLVLCVAVFSIGIANVWFTERYFFWMERRRYANPLDPSEAKLRNMKINGGIEILLGIFVAWLVVSEQDLFLTVKPHNRYQAPGSSSLFNPPKTQERNNAWQNNLFNHNKNPESGKR